jgi:hypothetical protein
VAAKEIKPDFMPPNPPWKRLQRAQPEEGYLSIYLSDSLARYPVRDITRINDNKSDPNIETLTYGLFSTCEDKMRHGVVRDGRPWLFFVTQIKNKGRCVAGMYEIGWHADGPLAPGARDDALAAVGSRWIDPIPASEIGGSLGELVRKRFRPYMGIDAAHTAELRALIASKPDRSAGYLSEISRLERFNAAFTGFTYPIWERGEPFTAQEAEPYLTPRDGGGEAAKNTSPTGRWRCVECGATNIGAARQKLCPACRAPGTLVPDETDI